MIYERSCQHHRSSFFWWSIDMKSFNYWRLNWSIKLLSWLELVKYTLPKLDFYLIELSGSTRWVRSVKGMFGNVIFFSIIIKWGETEERRDPREGSTLNIHFSRFSWDESACKIWHYMQTQVKFNTSQNVLNVLFTSLDTEWWCFFRDLTHELSQASPHEVNKNKMKNKMKPYKNPLNISWSSDHGPKTTLFVRKLGQIGVRNQFSLFESQRRSNVWNQLNFNSSSEVS